MMRTILTATLALPLLVWADLPLCSNTIQPCSCPAGSTFKNITTYGVIGATASDVGSVMNNFWETNWIGTTSSNLTGTDNVVGATRTLAFTVNNTAYALTEELIDYEVDADGSFLQRFRQNPTPAIIAQPGGYFEGYWETIDVQQTLMPNESAIIFSAYRCDIGDSFDTANFHVTKIQNASSILADEGKHTGEDIAPYSIFSLISG
ncbi:hypothetical protein MMC28_006090 [Mycoblastus sanguinarius]|nr:hypothetical protein [Mycoblastus sanguinarius]